MKNIKALGLSIALAQAAGLLGSFFTASSIETWYVFLNKPLWTPPAWLFGPVWLVLYTSMGVAAYRIWGRRKEKGAAMVLKVYAFQLGLNALWSPLFFGLKNIGLGLVVILALLLSILWTMRCFWRLDHAAANLLLPYLAWVTFATALNFTLWLQN